MHFILWLGSPLKPVVRETIDLTAGNGGGDNGFSEKVFSLIMSLRLVDWMAFVFSLFWTTSSILMYYGWYFKFCQYLVGFIK